MTTALGPSLARTNDSPAARSPSDTGTRLLLVAPPPGVRDSILRWTDDLAVTVTVAVSRTRAARYLATEPWDIVVVAPAEDPAAEVAQWSEEVQRAQGAPRLVALIDQPSMDLGGVRTERARGRPVAVAVP
jgi:hypothetical protein